ncbi:MAG: site-specific integrase, partial [Tyzzerella sp.]|nr:site-specific integrase [Tyzzerella sp.]
MRIGEIIGLKWSDIDFVNRTIYVNRTLVYIKSDDAISPRDTTVVMKFITERIRKKRPDFEPVTPHTLRHTFATRCIERGMNPKTLQIILGHSTIQLTMN